MNTRIETINGEKFVNGFPFDNQLAQASRILMDTGSQGGGTFNVSLDDGFVESVEVNGYAVGGVMDSVVVNYTGPRAWRNALDAVGSFIHRIPRNLDGDRMYFLGTWIDEGKLHIDATEVYTDIDEAMDVARKRGEIAVYDGIEGEDINVNAYFVAEQKAIEAAEEQIERKYSPTAGDVPWHEFW